MKHNEVFTVEQVPEMLKRKIRAIIEIGRYLSVEKMVENIPVVIKGDEIPMFRKYIDAMYTETGNWMPQEVEMAIWGFKQECAMYGSRELMAVFREYVNTHRNEMY